MATKPCKKAKDDLFTRRLVYAEGKSLVESRCTRCGALVIGSATESLIEDEIAHLRECANVLSRHRLSFKSDDR